MPAVKSPKFPISSKFIALRSALTFRPARASRNGDRKAFMRFPDGGAKMVDGPRTKAARQLTIGDMRTEE
jgi:hypothetical protein